MNETKFNEIKELVGDEFNSLKRAYIQDSCDRLSIIEKSIAQDDFDEVRQVAHALKSSSANIGADEVSNLAATIEKFALENQSAKLKSLYPGLKKAVEDSITFMNN